MAQESNARTRSISDPRALRALADPIRLKLHGLVGREGTLTAADAARQLGISHALASHHLHQLAKYGFVEQADAPDQRARPWRVTSTSYSSEVTTPDAQSADDTLQRYAAQRAADELADWQQRPDPGDGWAELGGVWSGLLYLTPHELRALLDQWTRIVMPYVNARPIGHHDARPDDARPIAITLTRVPLPPTEHGG